VVFLKSRRGEIYDASGEPGFRPAIEEEFADLQVICRTDAGLNASPCAALLANAARLGRYSETREDIAAAIAAGVPFESGWGVYSFCEDDECESQAEFEDYLTSVDFALEKWGYLRK
jgi:hypothetical protein